MIDAFIGDQKQIHAELDYRAKTSKIHSFNRADGTPVELTREDITTFQKLLVSAPPKMNINTRLGEALASFLNLIASAPGGNAIDLESPESAHPGAQEKQ